MLNTASLAQQKLTNRSLNCQNGSVCDFHSELSTVGGNQQPDFCQQSLLPVENFDLLNSATLTADPVSDQIYSGILVSNGNERKCQGDYLRYQKELGSGSENGNTSRLYVGDYVLLDNELEYQLSLALNENGDGFYLPKPKDCGTAGYSLQVPEPVRKTPKYFSFRTHQNRLKYSELDQQTSIETAECFVASKHVDSNDSDAITISNTSEIQNIASATVIERSKLSEVHIRDHVETDDNVDCHDTCVCKGGHSIQVESIERVPGMKVSTPLYVKLLKYRLMRKSNKVHYDCCARRCSRHWSHMKKRHLMKDYQKSDLRLGYFKWGTWKVEEEESSCPATCICKTGRSFQVPDIERKPGFNVVVPLYKKVLQLCLDRNLEQTSSDNLCNLNSHERQMAKNCQKSDLSLSRFSWGDWKEHKSCGSGKRRRLGREEKKKKKEKKKERREKRKERRKMKKEEKERKERKKERKRRRHERKRKHLKL